MTLSSTGRQWRWLVLVAAMAAATVLLSTGRSGASAGEMPAMTAESMQAAGPHIQGMMEKVMDRAEKMAEEDRKKQSGSSQPATDKN